VDVELPLAQGGRERVHGLRLAVDQMDVPGLAFGSVQPREQLAAVRVGREPVQRLDPGPDADLLAVDLDVLGPVLERPRVPAAWNPTNSTVLR